MLPVCFFSSETEPKTEVQPNAAFFGSLKRFGKKLGSDFIYVGWLLYTPFQLGGRSSPRCPQARPELDEASGLRAPAKMPGIMAETAAYAKLVSRF